MNAGPSLPAARTVVLAVAAALALALAFAARDALVPFILGLLVAYICAPAAESMVSRGVPRWVAALVLVIAALLALLLIPLLVIPLLAVQAYALIASVPDMLDALLPRLQEHLPMLEDFEMPSFKELLPHLADQAGKTGGAALTVFGWLGSGIGAVITAGLILLIMPIVMFFLLADWPGVLQKGKNLLPAAYRANLLEIAGACDRVLSEFLRAQLMVMILMAIIYSVLLALTGLPNAVAVGTVSGLMVFIPYAGFLFGLALALLIAAVEFNSLIPVVWVAAAMTAGTLFESLVLTPWLVGERTGLGPLAVLLALSVMGAAFGFVGVLMAIPAAAVLAAVWRHMAAQQG